MNFVFHAPSVLLSPFIKTFLIVESQDEITNRVLPDTSPVIAFRYKGEIHYGKDGATEPLGLSVISGLRKSPRLISYGKNTGNILVIFKEAAASVFFKEPLHELFEESVSLDHFFDQQKVSILEEQLAEAPDNLERISLVEQFLLLRLSRRNPDLLISSAMGRIHAAKGIVKMKKLASDLCISQDAFEKRFRKIAGTSPKQFSSIVRMKSVISEKRQGQIFTDVALESGYFDQAHFNKEFKLFTGQAPADFFKSPARW